MYIRKNKQTIKDKLRKPIAIAKIKLCYYKYFVPLNIT